MAVSSWILVVLISV